MEVYGWREATPSRAGTHSAAAGAARTSPPPAEVAEDEEEERVETDCGGDGGGGSTDGGRDRGGAYWIWLGWAGELRTRESEDTRS